jgi:DNA-binding SARP family transcriptional activator
VLVLGSVDVVPWRSPPTRKVLTEIACYLTHHRKGPVSGEELQMALSSDAADSPDASPKTIRNYMSEFRKALGAELVPSARGSGYQLESSVTSDWDEFKSFATHPKDGSWEEIVALGEALNLVRGRPFAGTNYKWVNTELLVSEMEVAISDVARRLALVATALGNIDIAWFAGRRAILACPYDIGLWEIALNGASAMDSEELALTWHDAQVALGDDAKELEELVKSLGAH